MSSIPVVLCGKSPMLATSFISALESHGPQVDVVHVIHDFATGSRELPALLRGEPVRAASGLGSNCDNDNDSDTTTTTTPRSHRAPKAVVVGKGFSEEEITQLRSIQDAQNVPWLLPDDQKMTWTRIAKVAGTAGVALPGIVAERVVACLEENGLLKEGGEEGRKGQVFWF